MSAITMSFNRIRQVNEAGQKLLQEYLKEYPTDILAKDMITKLPGKYHLMSALEVQLMASLVDKTFSELVMAYGIGSAVITVDEMRCACAEEGEGYTIGKIMQVA